MSFRSLVSKITAKAKPAINKVASSKIGKAVGKTLAMSTAGGRAASAISAVSGKKIANPNAFGYGYKPTTQQQKNLSGIMAKSSQPGYVKLPSSSIGRNLASGGLPGVARGLERAGSRVAGAVKALKSGMSNIGGNRNTPNIGGGSFNGTLNSGIYMQGPNGQTQSFNTPNGLPPANNLNDLTDQYFYDEEGNKQSFNPEGGPTPVDRTSPPADKQAQVNAIANEKAMTNTLAGEAVDAGFAGTEQNQGDQEGLDITELTPREYNYDSMIKALEDEIEKLQNAGPSDLEEQFNQLSEQEQTIKDNAARSQQAIAGQPIPYQFITGQGARIQDLANTDLNRVAGQQQTLQQRLAQEAERRQLKINALNQKYERMQRLRDDQSNRRYEESRYKQERADKLQQNRYMTVGGNVYDKMTGKFISGPTKWKKVVTTTNKPPKKTGGTGGGGRTI